MTEEKKYKTTNNTYEKPFLNSANDFSQVAFYRPTDRPLARPHAQSLSLSISSCLSLSLGDLLVLRKPNSFALFAFFDCCKTSCLCHRYIDNIIILFVSVIRATISVGRPMKLNFFEDSKPNN